MVPVSSIYIGDHKTKQNFLKNNCVFYHIRALIFFSYFLFAVVFVISRFFLLFNENV